MKKGVYVVVLLLVLFSAYFLMNFFNEGVVGGKVSKEGAQLQSNNVNYIQKSLTNIDYNKIITPSNAEQELRNYMGTLNINDEHFKLDKITQFKNKLFVYFDQYYKNIPVYNSKNVFYVNNEKLSFTKTNYYGKINLDVNPSIRPGNVFNFIREDFETKKLIKRDFESKFDLKENDKIKLSLNEIQKNYYDISGKKREYDFSKIDINKINIKEPKLIIYPMNNKYFLTYQVETNSKDFDLIYFINANTGKVIDIKDNRIYYGISGNVTGKEWEDPFTSQTQLEKPFIHNNFTINDQEIITDETGYYSVSDLSGLTNLESYLSGQWVTVYNSQLEKSKHVSSFNDNSEHNWDWDLDDNSYLDEESNAFYHVNKIHDYAVSIGANEMNFNMVTNVNINNVCNAYYDGESINFFKKGSYGFYNCESTGVISDVIYHEYGHGIIHELNPSLLEQGYWGESGNIHEGLADYFACSLNNNSDQGEGFFIGNSNPLRVCNSDDKYPEDYNPEPHSGAQIISGAMWDIREGIERMYLDPLLTNALRLQPISFSELLESLIIADDDNDNLGDGTPNINLICDSFLDHGIYSDYCAGFTSKSLAIIKEPKINQIISGVMNITGTAYPSKNNQLINYKLEINGQEVGTFTDPVLNNNLYSLDTTYFNDGENILKLIVTDSSDHVSEFAIKVVIVNMEFNYPNRDDVLRAGEVIEINGTILSNKFRKYGIEYGVGKNPEEWHDGGINLVNEGQYQIINGVLGRWNTSFINEANFYTLRITVDGNIVKYKYLTFYLDPKLKKGWPITFDWSLDKFGEHIYPGSMRPYVLDLDNDNENEVIFLYGANLSKIFIYDQNGNLIREIALPISNAFMGYHAHEPSFGDIDGNGDLEIVICMQNSLSVINHDGSLLWKDDTSTDLCRSSITPVITDLNNDGKMETILQTISHLNIYNNIGTKIYNYNLPEGSRSYFSNFFPVPIVVKSDKAKFAEIFLIDPIEPAATIYLFNFDSGFSNPNIKKVSFDGFAIDGSSPIAGDLNDDSKDEIIFNLYDRTSEEDGKGSTVFVVNENLELLEGWPTHNLDGNFFSGLALGNLDEDDEIEITFGSNADQTYILNPNGSIGYRPIFIVLAQTIFDVNGDKKQDMASFYWDMFSGHNRGELLFNLKTVSNGAPSPPTLADVDNDGKFEVLGSTSWVRDDEGNYMYKAKSYIWETEYDSKSLSDWPMFQHDAQHTGNYGNKIEIKNKPKVKLESPINQTFNLKQQIQFNCLVQAKNNEKITKVELWLNEPSKEFYINETKIINKQVDRAIFYKKFNREGNYTWNCKAYDSKGNYEWGYVDGKSAGFKIKNLPKCSDNTNANSCSKVKPKYCSYNEQTQLSGLINNCQICGCNQGFSCQSSGICKKGTSNLPKAT